MKEPARDADLASLLPQSGPALFAERVLELDEGEIVCSGRVPLASPYVRDGMTPTFTLLELAAQAAAALEAVGRSGEPRVDADPNGLLVRVNELRCVRPDVPAGTVLVARVSRIVSNPPLFTYRATVALDGAKCMSARFSIYSEGSFR